MYPDGGKNGEPIVSFDQAQLYFRRLNEDSAFRKQILDAQCSPLPSIVNEVLGSADFSTLSERKKVIYEMLKSEVVYVRDLRRFDRLYAEPLKQAANGGMLKVLVGWRN